MDSDFNLLRTHIQQFIQLPENEWQMLLPHLSNRFVKKHDYFEREGKVARDVGYIVEGNMRHFYTNKGEEKTTYFYFENTLVASYISCLSGQPSQLSIEALSNTSLIVFPYSVLQTLYAQSQVWERFGRLVSEYLAIGLEERMVGLLTLSPEERYMQLLNSNKKKILERVPQHYIANYLGITPVSLSRIRNRVLKGAK
jgi:CRP-like cAMP-binding protein